MGIDFCADFRPAPGHWSFLGGTSVDTQQWLTLLVHLKWQYYGTWLIFMISCTNSITACRPDSIGLIIITQFSICKPKNSKENFYICSKTFCYHQLTEHQLDQPMKFFFRKCCSLQSTLWTDVYVCVHNLCYFRNTYLWLQIIEKSTSMAAPKTSIPKDDTLFRIPPFFYIHVLDQNTNVTSLEIGPKIYIRQDNERCVASTASLPSVLW